VDVLVLRPRTVSLSVAQWIVHMPPKRGIQVRFLSEGPKHNKAD
jgi:hypothetical protein